VHAGSREEPGFDTGILPFNVGDQFDPVDGSTLQILGADDGNIVFRLTGDDTGLAGRASVQVDDHAHRVCKLCRFRHELSLPLSLMPPHDHPSLPVGRQVCQRKEITPYIFSPGSFP